MGQQMSRNYSSPSQASKFVQSVVHQNCVVIFSKTDCPYSVKAKKVFKKLGVDYYAVELNKREDCDILQDILQELTGAKTVPRVFINGSCIGGGIDAENLYKQGKLEDLVDQCAQKY